MASELARASIPTPYSLWRMVGTVVLLSLIAGKVKFPVADDLRVGKIGSAISDPAMDRRPPSRGSRHGTPSYLRLMPGQHIAYSPVRLANAAIFGASCGNSHIPAASDP
jgi:hypothetical protein